MTFLVGKFAQVAALRRVVWRRSGGVVAWRRTLATSAIEDFQATVIDTEEKARNFLEQAKALPEHWRFACDTEVDIDLKTEGPVGNGKVTCVSISPTRYHDFGNGPDVWIDLLDGEPGVYDVVKEFLESNRFQKVWHNYSFDYHVLKNIDIECGGFAGDTMHMARLHNTSYMSYSLESLTKFFFPDDVTKTSMKDLFGIPKLKRDGTPGKTVTLPSIPSIQRGNKRDEWIRYSCLDSCLTARLFVELKKLLEGQRWGSTEAAAMSGDNRSKNLFKFYQTYLVPFAIVLVNIERAGFQLDLKHFAQIQKIAEVDAKAALEEFKRLSFECGGFKSVEDAMDFNPSSLKQRQFLLYAKKGVLKTKFGNTIPATCLVPNVSGPGKVEEKGNKTRTLEIVGFGLPQELFTPSNLPSASSLAMAKLVKHAKPKVAETIGKLSTAGSIEKLLSTFILPLQKLVDADGRIHCSLNLNTDTGRLSSRNPNLQNQPALEKDVYKIRKGFISPPGKKLIVADYGQLELRVLAHLSNCASMIDAFEKGGDFHSRTAMGMYKQIKEDLDAGKVLLEWDSKDGTAPAPLIKDKYASERRKAKVLNFSIAYGKTATGLSKDFGITVQEAEEVCNLWYADRPEVRKWQYDTIEFGRKFGYVSTIWGRRRHLPGFSEGSRKLEAAASRAAINSPIQGSAADVVMGAMLKVGSNQRLQELGWRMVLQVHDEIILEGPEESVDEAKSLLVACMKDPIYEKLLVELTVDANSADTWYDAK